MMEIEIDNLAKTISVPVDLIKPKYVMVLNAYKAKYPTEKEEVLAKRALDDLALRLGKIKSVAGAKDFEIAVVGSDGRVRDYLETVRNKSSEEMSKDPSNAISNHYATAEGVLLDHRRTFERSGKKNDGFRSPIGCPICLPLIEAGNWEQLLNGREDLKGRGCNCVTPRTYKKVQGFIQIGGTFYATSMEIGDKAVLKEIETNKVYKVHAVLKYKDDDKRTAVLTTTTTPTDSTMQMPSILDLLNVMPSIYVRYGDLLQWANQSEGYDNWFITEANVAAISPTETQSGSRQVQFDDYEQIESMDMPVLSGYMSSEDIEKKKITQMSRVYIIGNVYFRKEKGETDGEKTPALIIMNIIPKDAGTIPEIKPIV